MAFEIVQTAGNAPQSIWLPVDDSVQLWVGSLVKFPAAVEGCVLLTTASGAYDTSTKSLPLGIVIGTNNKNPLYDSAKQQEYITDATPFASTTDFVLVEGPWSKGDKEAMVKVAIIDHTTILRAPIYNSTLGTALALQTSTVASSAGTGQTTNATQVATLADNSVVWFRTGLNAGSARVLATTSTTVQTWTKPLTNKCVIGDTSVSVNLKWGQCFMQIDSSAQFIDASAALTSDYYGIEVLRLDLREAGKEHCYFRFNSVHFDPVRA